MIPSADRMSRFASADPSPEDLLIAAEESAAGDADAEPAPRRPLLTSDELHELLERLPAHEREAVLAYYGGEQRQRDTAARVGCSQPSVHNRIKRGVQRLRWIAAPPERPELAGPGAWFRPEDLERDLRATHTADERRALVLYWRSTCVRTVQEHMFIRTHADAWRLLHGAIAKLAGRYREGFERASKTGKWLLSHEVGDPSAVADFVARRLVFDRAGRTPGPTLFGAYEAHATALGRPASRRKLVDALVAGGARRVFMRTAWAPSVRGFAGVRVQTTAHAAP